MQLLDYAQDELDLDDCWILGLVIVLVEVD